MDTPMMDAGIPTPPASSVTASHHPSPLPQPRRHPLKPGGPKESEVIRYLDHGLNDVQKCVDNRMKKGEEEGRAPEAQGYTSFAEVEKDLEGLLDVVWVSGSPNLQIPYLLNIARMIAEFLPLFRPAPRHTFALLSKLDAAFSSLLFGHDPDSNEPLPGFEHGRTISTTDKVRLKGIVERTRVVVAKRLGAKVDGDAEEEGIEGKESGDETSADEGMVNFEGFENNEDDESEEDDNWEEVAVGSVYERTIAELGDVLGGPPIGIISDD